MAKKKVSKKPAKEPIFKLPPYKVEQVFVTLSETIDWGLKMFNIPKLWADTLGAGIKVAVLDTGIDYDHPDLKNNIADMKDFTGSRTGPYDKQGHGTHVAGTIAAVDDNKGVIGVAPKAKLYIGKVLGDNGSGSSQSVANGVLWAAEMGCDIISMSLGAPQPSRQIHSAIQEASRSGSLVIAAAGNEGPRMNTVGYPGGYPETIAVGAIDRRGKITNFSSRGKQVDIVAPGDQILSTYPRSNYAKLSGTSMATPFVTGVTALVLAKHRKKGGDTPIDSYKDLREHLQKTAIDIGKKGWDPFSGFGYINPAGLIKYGVVPPPTTGKKELVVLYGGEEIIRGEAELSETGKNALKSLLKG